MMKTRIPPGRATAMRKISAMPTTAGPTAGLLLDKNSFGAGAAFDGDIGAG